MLPNKTIIEEQQIRGSDLGTDSRVHELLSGAQEVGDPLHVTEILVAAVGFALYTVGQSC